MFYMVSENGNAHRKVKSERKRDELIALGYKLVEAPVEGETESPLSPDGDIPPLGKGGAEVPAEVATETEVNPKKRKTKKNAAEE